MGGWAGRAPSPDTDKPTRNILQIDVHIYYILCTYRLSPTDIQTDMCYMHVLSPIIKALYTSCERVLRFAAKPLRLPSRQRPPSHLPRLLTLVCCQSTSTHNYTPIPLLVDVNEICTCVRSLSCDRFFFRGLTQMRIAFFPKPRKL